MRRRYLWRGIILLFLMASSFLLTTIPSTPGLAHSSVSLESPTPTPDANATLQMAQQEEVNIQTILNIINVLVVVYPILITLAALLLGFFGFRGLREVEEQGKRLLEDIKRLQEEANERKTTIEHTQEALVYFALGDRLANQNDTRKAIEAYKKVGDLLPNDAQINYVLGRIYSGIGYYEDAIKSFEATLAAQPQHAEAEMELGLAYRRRGEYLKGSDAETLRNRDYEKAAEHLRRAIDLHANYDDALSTLAGLYRRKGEYKQALEYYEQAYRADRSSSYAAGNAASLSWYLKDWEKADRYYKLTETLAKDRMMTTHAEVYWDYYDLALAQLVLGKTEEANQSYQKAIGETPGAVQFDSVLSVLRLLQQVQERRIPGLDDVIHKLEKERMAKVSLE